MFLPDPASAGPMHGDGAHLAPLNPLELSAAMLARTDAGRYGWDASSSSRGKGRLRDLLARVTGIKGVTPLADARLEKLRLFACMVRRGDPRMGAVGDDLRGMGYRPQALRHVMTLALG